MSVRRRRTVLLSAAVGVVLVAAFAGASVLMQSARSSGSGEAALEKIDVYGRVRAYHLATDGDSLKRLRPNLRRLLGERPGGSVPR